MIATWKDFFINVEQMRECQKDYFRTRSPSALALAKRMEKQVDDAIGYINQKKDKQPFLGF